MGENIKRSGSSASTRMDEPWISLQNQSRARPVTDAELAFAEALEAAYRDGIDDFEQVARRLTEAGIVAPSSGTTQWTLALLEKELATINASLDEAYARYGIGA